MLHQRGERLLPILAWGNTHAHLRARHGHELVDRVAHRRRVDRQHRDRRLHPHTVGEATLSDELHTAPRAGLLSQLILGEVELLGLAAHDAFDRDVAFLVVQRREQVSEGRQGVGEGAAELARVHGLVEDAKLHHARDHATQRRGEGRLAQSPVAAVGDDDGIAGEPLALLLEIRTQILRAGLFLALDEHRDPHRGRPLEDAERGDVRDHAGLVVGAATAVQTAVAHRRGEGRRAPLALRPRRLHVVVRVEEDGRSAGRRLHVADHSRVPVLGAEDLHLGADTAKHLGDRVGGCAERLRRPVHRAHRRDRDQRLEIRPDLGHRRVDAGLERGSGRCHHPGVSDFVPAHALLREQACGHSKDRRASGRSRTTPCSRPSSSSGRSGTSATDR